MFLSFALILLAFAFWWIRVYTFWQRHGIRHIKPWPLIGTIRDVLTFRKNIGVHFYDIYRDPRFVNEPIVGVHMLHQPALVIREPDLLKYIFIKDFNSFHDRYIEVDGSADPFGALNLFVTEYKNWSKIRPKFSPTFTSGKLKKMFPLMMQIAHNMENHLLSKGDNFNANVKQLCALYTTDQISSIAFGIETQSFENPNNEFALQNEDNVRERPAYFIMIMLILPQLAKLFRATFFTQKYQQFMRTSMNDIMAQRIKSNTKRNDLLDTIIELRQEIKATEEKNDQQHDLTDDMLLAQGGMFYLAGYETSMEALTYTLYLLAQHPKIQNRLRNEIKEALKDTNGSITYDSLMSLKYLDMVISESLRLYPVVPYVDRKHNCLSGGFSLKPYAGFTLPDGMPVFVSILGLHRDEKYWPHPNVFDPERFSPTNSIPAYAYLPFGLGSHNCIGARLAQLQIKVGLLHFLRNFEVRTCSDTIDEFKYCSNAVTLMSEDDIYLKFVKNS
ncbi:cytochrome P450 6g1-like [Musca autumnalis]|uniref:cytochrome P450 6g1-like n=1 Tax=Musca autumnalis TaxID=221902 RepID=UPI003CF42D3B